MTFTKDAILERLISAYSGPGSTQEGTFTGDILRACADMMAELYSLEIDGLERRAFVSTATGDWLTAVCADRGVVRKDGETDEALRTRTLAKLSRLPASGNADHYVAWCTETEDILRVKILPSHRGPGTVDIIAVGQDGHAPSEADLETAQTRVDLQRPIGADAQVLSAEETPLNISATVILTSTMSLSLAKSRFEESLVAFCRENALLTTTISYAKILRLLLDTEGVADVTDLLLNGGDESLALSETAIPVKGIVTLTEANA